MRNTVGDNEEPMGQAAVAPRLSVLANQRLIAAGSAWLAAAKWVNFVGLIPKNSRTWPLSLALIVAFAIGYRIEHHLHQIAIRAGEDSTLPPSYFASFKSAAPIGGGALIMSVLALALMIFKPN